VISLLKNYATRKVNVHGHPLRDWPLKRTIAAGSFARQSRAAAAAAAAAAAEERSMTMP